MDEYEIPQPKPKNVVEVHKLPSAQTVSTTLIIITIVVLVFAIVGGIAYYSFNSTLQARMQEREQNDILYNDPNQQNILGMDDALPEVKIGGSGGGADGGLQKPGQGQPMTAQQQQQMMMQQQAQQAQGKQQQIPPKPDSKTSPTPTTVPENVFVGKDGMFSFEHDKWKKGQSSNEDSTEIESLASKDGKYILYIGIVNKKYDSISAYLDTDPRGRKPQNGTSDITMGGESGKKVNTFTGTFSGSTYKTTAAYVFSKDKEKIYFLELDSTELDVNNTSNEDVFKKITDSFKFIEKKDE